jgi:hypothetical protein
MTQAGLRYDGSGWKNNAIATLEYVYDGLALQPGSGLYFKQPYLGCGQQSDFVINEETPLIPKLQDNWSFDQPWKFDPLFHQYVKAHDGNPSDPDIILDPYNNEYQLVPKGGNPGPWHPLSH